MKKSRDSRECEGYEELFSNLPENALISSEMSLRGQKIIFDENNFHPHKEWMQSFSEKLDREKLQKATSFTINNLSEKNHKIWDQMANSSHLYNMADCMNQKACTCFHRSIFLNFLLSQVDIQSGIVQGRVIESTKDIRLAYPPHVSARLDAFALGFNEEDFVDAHLWNIVELDGNFFLVDSSFLIEGKPLVEPITFDGSYPNSFKIDVGEGKFRYYLLESKALIEKLSS